MHRAALLAMLLAGAVAGAGCSNGGDERGGDATTASVDLVAAPGTPAAVVAAAVDGVEARVAWLRSAGLVGAFSVTARDDRIVVQTTPSLAGDVARALGARGLVELRPAVAGVPDPSCGPATGTGDAVPLPGFADGVVVPCFLVGAATPLTGTVAVELVAGGDVWTLAATLSPEVQEQARTLAAGASGQQVAFVLDGIVAAAPVVDSAFAGVVTIGAGWDRAHAAGIGAVLAGGPLDVALRADVPVRADEPEVGDVWRFRLDVNVCGRWLPAAPATEGNLHTHGDGFFMLHPLNEAEAGANATLARVLASGGWSVGTDRLQVWDGVAVGNGDPCPGGPGRLRWSVNGKGREGDPSAYRPRDGDRVVLAFLEEDAEPVQPPP